MKYAATIITLILITSGAASAAPAQRPDVPMPPASPPEATKSPAAPAKAKVAKRGDEETAPASPVHGGADPSCNPPPPPPAGAEPAPVPQRCHTRRVRRAAPTPVAPPAPPAPPPATVLPPPGYRCPPATVRVEVVPAPCMARYGHYYQRPPRVRRHIRPTAMFGFTSDKGKIAAQMEIGYPFLAFELNYGIAKRFQLGVGYRTLYSFTHTPHILAKIGLSENSTRTFGLSLKLGFGYAFPRDKNEAYGPAQLAGEYGFVGEAWLLGTARRGRHGVYFGIGARMSQRAEGGYYYADCIGDCSGWGGGDTTRKFMATGSIEIGYELRINRSSSFFIGLGVDMFSKPSEIPALPRFRFGLNFGS